MEQGQNDNTTCWAFDLQTANLSLILRVPYYLLQILFEWSLSAELVLNPEPSWEMVMAEKDKEPLVVGKE